MIRKLLKKLKPRGKLTPDDVKLYYENWTDRYVKTFGQTFQSLQTANVEDLFNYFIVQSGMENGQRVLDAGCGVCGPAIYFAGKLNIHLDAVTISELQRQLSEENIQKARDALKGTVNVRQGDFHQLEKMYPEKSYDLIYFLESLTHSTDLANVLKSCERILKPNGRIYIKDLYYRQSDNKETRRQIDIAVANVNREFSLHVEKLSTFKEIITRSGFKVEFCQPLGIDPDYSFGNKFVAANDITIYENQEGLYDGLGVPYLDYYEIKLIKPIESALRTK